jgi:cytosine/adenosine deaminase-related metal-dependent hydrolase
MRVFAEYINVANAAPLINLIQVYGLLDSGINIVLSHATGLTDHERNELIRTGVPISSTPDTEAQMGFGWPLAFEPGINTTIGVDCHSNNTASLLSLARSALQIARLKETMDIQAKQDSDIPTMKREPRGDTEAVFNAITIGAAKAIKKQDQIGSLREGKLADLVIFDAANSPGMSCVFATDALTSVVRHSDIRDVEAVMVDGIWRKRGGKLCDVVIQNEQGMEETIDFTIIRNKLLESHGQILARQRGLNFQKANEASAAMLRLDQNKFV